MLSSDFRFLQSSLDMVVGMPNETALLFEDNSSALSVLSLGDEGFEMTSTVRYDSLVFSVSRHLLAASARFL